MVGRYLKIWAEEHRELHQKEFINVGPEAQGDRILRVDSKDATQMRSGWGSNVIALDGPDHPSGRDPCISLEEWPVGGNRPQDRYVRLDRSYLVSLGKYKCQDPGMLRRDSLGKLQSTLR